MISAKDTPLTNFAVFYTNLGPGLHIRFPQRFDLPPGRAVVSNEVTPSIGQCHKDSNADTFLLKIIICHLTVTVADAP